MRKGLLIFLWPLCGCMTTGFPVRQTPPAALNAAIQQEVVARAIEKAVAKLKIEPKAMQITAAEAAPLFG